MSSLEYLRLLGELCRGERDPLAITAIAGAALAMGGTHSQPHRVGQRQKHRFGSVHGASHRSHVTGLHCARLCFPSVTTTLTKFYSWKYSAQGKKKHVYISFTSKSNTRVAPPALHRTSGRQGKGFSANITGNFYFQESPLLGRCLWWRRTIADQLWDRNRRPQNSETPFLFIYFSSFLTLSNPR